jgi:hypothetical protein
LKSQNIQFDYFKGTPWPDLPVLECFTRLDFVERHCHIARWA